MTREEFINHGWRYGEKVRYAGAICEVRSVYFGLPGKSRKSAYIRLALPEGTASVHYRNVEILENGD